MHKFTYYFDSPEKITENDKILIGIGDSFCAGRGACSLELWKKYDWDMDRMYGEGGVEVNKSNYENSWVNQLCKNHMPDWKPVNLGMSGKGNRFAVNELFVSPLLNLEKAKEKIVVFAVSGFERFDLVNNLITEEHFVTQWPIFDGWGDGRRIGYAELTKDIDNKSIYDETFVLCEFILNIIHLTNWCKLHNAKLLLISAFTPELNVDYFREDFTKHSGNPFTEKVVCELLKLVPWGKIIRPMGFSCITDMLMHLEGWDEFMPNYGFRNMDIKTVGPNEYMTKCQHPTEKGHKLLAEIIYEHIVNYDNLEDVKIEPNFKKYYPDIDDKPKNGSNFKLI